MEIVFQKILSSKFIHVSWDKSEIFWIAMSPMSDNKLYRSRFLVKGLDKHYHLHV